MEKENSKSINSMKSKIEQSNLEIENKFSELNNKID